VFFLFRAYAAINTSCVNICKRFLINATAAVVSGCCWCCCWLLLVLAGCCSTLLGWWTASTCAASFPRKFAISFRLWQWQLFCNYVATSWYIHTLGSVCACVSMFVIVVTCSFIDINMNKCDRSTSADCTTSKKRFQENMLKIRSKNNSSSSNNEWIITQKILKMQFEFLLKLNTWRLKGKLQKQFIFHIVTISKYFNIMFYLLKCF